MAISPPIYEYELLTAEDKADYFDDLVRNRGREDHPKISKDCRRRAAKLLKEANLLEPDEAKPLTWRAHGLENLADHLDEMAKNPDEDDHAEDAAPEKLEELKAKAEYWRNIHEWNQMEKMAQYFPGPSKPADWLEAMFVRAQKDPFAVSLLKNAASHPVSRLLELANMGNAEAARAAVDILEELVRTLNLYAKANPEPFRQAARNMTHWPVMYSRHPKLAQNPKDVSAQVELGKDYALNLDSMARWDHRKLGCKIALELFRQLDVIRRHPECHRHLPFWEQATKLPSPKESGAAAAWWVVAKQHLLFGVPVPEQDELLTQFARGEAVRKYPSTIKHKILERLQDQFEQLFPMESR